MHAAMIWEEVCTKLKETMENYDFLYLLLLLVVTVLIFLSEIIRYVRLNKIRLEYFRSDYVSYPILSLAILGSASIVFKVLHSRDENIFKWRKYFTDTYNGLYCAYRWNWRCIFNWSPKTINPSFLLVADPDIARRILENPAVWVKSKQRVPLNLISGLACTSQNGEESRKHRYILINSMKNRKKYEIFIKEAGEKMCRTIYNLFSLNNSNNLIPRIESNRGESDAISSITSDVLPIFMQTSLDLMMWTLFGLETPGMPNISFSYYLYYY